MPRAPAVSPYHLAHRVGTGVVSVGTARACGLARHSSGAREMSAVNQGPFLETSFLLGPDRGQWASLSASTTASPEKPASRTERAWPDAMPAQ